MCRDSELTLAIVLGVAKTVSSARTSRKLLERVAAHLKGGEMGLRTKD